MFDGGGVEGGRKGRKEIKKKEEAQPSRQWQETSSDGCLVNLPLSFRWLSTNSLTCLLSHVGMDRGDGRKLH